MTAPFHVCSFGVSWCSPIHGWRQEQAILPKRGLKEDLGEYYARLVSYLRLSHGIPADATIILSGPSLSKVKLSPMIQEIGEWLRYGGEEVFFADPKNKGKNPPNRTASAWNYADMIERRWGIVKG